MISKIKNGYIALMSIVLMSGVLLAVSLVMAHQSINNTIGVFDWIESQQARQMAESCAEYAVSRLSENTSYVGQETISINSESCYINTIGGSGATNRSITTFSTVDGIFTKRWTVGTGIINIQNPEIKFFKEVAN